MNHIKKHQTISGYEAIIEGAKKAQASFYAGYPITPSSEIMHLWSKLSTVSDKYKFIQMEDEIASIHSLIGASLAGSKSFTATSGPGFSLMQEGLGTAFVMQTPLVVINAQRQGPATGMPTIASQGDVLQTQFGTHGDYASIVFYPNSVEEMYRYTIEAFNAAEQALAPIILLTDAYSIELSEDVNLEKYKSIEIKNRALPALTKGNRDRHFTGLTITKDGIVDTINSEVYEEWIKERKNKVIKTGQSYYFYKTKEKKNAKKLIISYGITSRIIEEIVHESDKYSHFRPITLFPIKKELLENIANKYNEIIVIEMNEGQYANQIQNVLKRDIKKIRVIGAKPLKKDILKQIEKI